mgnify:CR=1 FL=1
MGYPDSIRSWIETRDPYLGSPAYHAFTGRHGLWAYAKGKSIVLFARNPDNAGQIMFYPQLGAPFPNLALELIITLPEPSGGYQFSRIEKSQADFMVASMNKKSKFHDYAVIEEPSLDWKFPVHTLSTDKVSQAQGKAFKSMRQALNLARKHKVEAQPITIKNDYDKLISIVQNWAVNSPNISDAQHQIDTYKYLLRLVGHPGLSLEGLKFFLNGQLVAFEIWDLPDSPHKAISNLAGFNKANMRGFSEYQHYTICDHLRKKGYQKICIGGSENESLDYFKRKMNPVESLDLKTISVEKRNDQKIAS